VASRPKVSLTRGQNQSRKLSIPVVLYQKDPRRLRHHSEVTRLYSVLNAPKTRCIDCGTFISVRLARSAVRNVSDGICLFRCTTIGELESDGM
jgi:hypothetical protein